MTWYVSSYGEDLLTSQQAIRTSTAMPEILGVGLDAVERIEELCAAHTCEVTCPHQTVLQVISCDLFACIKKRISACSRVARALTIS